MKRIPPMITAAATALIAFISHATYAQEAGVVRINDASRADQVVIRANNGPITQCGHNVQGYRKITPPSHYSWRNPYKGMHVKYNSYYADGPAATTQIVCPHCRGKHLGLFRLYQGCKVCRTKTPLFGHYKMIYPADPNYFDARDGRVHAAGTTGVPMAVPLAPVVHDQYNFGWGLPASRLTPISRILP